MNVEVKPISSASDSDPLAVQLARAIVQRNHPSIVAATREKLRLCLLDFFACAIEARTLPWARQAAALAEPGGGRATIIGLPQLASAQDAAFANGVAAHGLVREDMHAGAVSHLGVVVLPALLAVAQQNGLSGKSFTDAAIVGYEVGAKIGRALSTSDFTRMFRPTGFTGPLAAAAGLCHLLQMDEETTASALAFAANMTGGLNQWPHTGSDEMYFHPGHAAASAIRAVRLAQLGARGAPLALDGEAGLIRAYRPDRKVPQITLFDGPEPEIMSVYLKAAPVCNFAQTPCQAAIILAREEAPAPADISAIQVCVSEAARVYPGCDYKGPFERVLQAKMSIHFSVASALLRGKVDESSYTDLEDEALIRLAKLMTIEAAPEFTAAFPAAQGAEVIVTLNDGRTLTRSLDNVIPADSDLVRARFDEAASEFIGAARASQLQQKVDALEGIANIDDLMRIMAATSA